MRTTNISAWRWAQLIACCLLCAFAFALPLPCFGVFISPLVKSFGGNVTQVNLYFTFMTAAAVISCLFGTGILTRWLRPTVLICSVAMTAGYLLLALCPSIPATWIAGIIAGLCYPLCSSVLVPIVIGDWFDARRGLYVGIAFAFVGLAGMVFGPVLTGGIESFGWQVTLIAAACTMGIICALTAVFLLRRKPHENPEPANVTDIGEGSKDKSDVMSSESSAAGTCRYHAFNSPAFVFMLLAACFSGILGDLNLQINSIAQQSGFAPVIAGIAFSCISAGLLIGKLALGWLKDAKGPAFALTLGCCCGILSFAMISFAIVGSGVALLYTASVLAGLCTCLGTIAPALLAGGAFPGRLHSQAVGYATALCNIGMAIGTPIYSLCFDLTGTYLPVLFILCAVAVTTALFSRLCLRKIKDRPPLRASGR